MVVSLKQAALENSSTRNIQVSIIAPLSSDYGYGARGVRSLTRHQTYPDDKYEIIIVSDGAHPELAIEIKKNLRSHDSLIEHPRATLLYNSVDNEFQLYDWGTNHAQGKNLLFVELHCIYPRRFLESLSFGFGKRNLDVAATAWKPLARNSIAQAEELYLQEAVCNTISTNKSYWQCCRIQGFMIKASVYQAVGGFEYQYGRFAERALGAKLSDLNYNLGVVEEALLVHINTGSLMMLFPLQELFAYGECHYRSQHSASYCDRYFGDFSLWQEQWAEFPEAARSLVWVLLRSLFSVTPLAMKSVQFPQIAQAIFSSLVGLKWRLWLTKLKIFLAARQVQFIAARHNAETVLPYLDQWWTSVSHHGRLRYLVEHGVIAKQPISSTNAIEYTATQLNQGQSMGFYALETWQGQTFRWSSSVARFRLSLVPQAYRVTIHLLPIRPLNAALSLQWFWNTHQIRLFALDQEHPQLSFSVAQADFKHDQSEQYLTMLCNPVQPWKQGVEDRRNLGLPIHKVEISPMNPEKLGP